LDHLDELDLLVRAARSTGISGPPFFDDLPEVRYQLAVVMSKNLRPAASAAVASVRPANDGADDSSRTAETPLLAASGNPPPTSSVTDPNAPVLWRASFKI